MDKAEKNRIFELISADSFRTRFRSLIIAACMGPPVVGLSYLLHISMLTVEQMIVSSSKP